MLGEPSTDKQEVKKCRLGIWSCRMPLRVVQFAVNIQMKKHAFFPPETGILGNMLHLCSIALACLILLQSKKNTYWKNNHFNHVFFLSSKNKHDSTRLYFYSSKPLTRQKKLDGNSPIKPCNYSNHSNQWVSFKPRKSCQFFFTTQVTMFTPNLGTEWTA